jgi:nucleoredoxin
MSALLSRCTFQDRDGNVLDKDEVVLKSEKIALYFSGHFCAPCRQFTPLLKDFYAEVNEDEKMLEIIFVSLDKSKEDQETYHKEHSDWPRIAFDDEEIRLALKAEMGVEKIPALVILDNDKIKAKFTDGVNDVKNMGPMAYDLKWRDS